MSIERVDMDTDDNEVERLRARVIQLEDELTALQAWANGVVADAQQRVYWLDRLHLDLDPIMRHVPFDVALDVFRRLRHRYHRARMRVESIKRLVGRLTP